MHIYISLLRGINVSGQKKILMKDLKSLYESLNFVNVTTYIQSGNVIFSANETDISRLTDLIRNKIKTHYEFDVTVIIRTNSELQQVIERNPFIKRNAVDVKHLYVTFLNSVPEDINREDMDRVKKESEEYVLDGRELFLYFPEGYGTTKLSNAFLERKLNAEATTRNWKTVEKLLELASQ